MTTEAHAAERRRPPLIAVVTLLTAVLTVFLIAFAWPSARSAPRDVPLAVSGPAPAVQQVKAGLDQAVPGGFEVTAVPDRQAAVQRIKDRDAYGAIVLDSAQPEVLTASAGSPVIAQALTQLAGRLSPGSPAKVTDIVPLPKDIRGVRAWPPGRCRWCSAGSSRRVRSPNWSGPE
jgi:hypothetical protein